jgi:hypothetical protein
MYHRHPFFIYDKPSPALRGAYDTILDSMEEKGLFLFKSISYFKEFEDSAYGLSINVKNWFTLQERQFILIRRSGHNAS